LKPMLLVGALLSPLAYLLYRLFATGVDDPIKYIYTLTGATALSLLFATTTISMVRRAVNLLRYRRTVGLFGFFYALLHLLNFLVLDMELDLGAAVRETIDKPFIYLGMSAFVIVLFMAITSLRVLFTRFYRYHKVLYLALLLGSVHFAMAQKALSMTQWALLGVMALIGMFKLLQRTGVLKL